MKGTKLCDRNLERGDGSKVSLLHEDAAVKGNLCPDGTVFVCVDCATRYEARRADIGCARCGVRFRHAGTLATGDLTVVDVETLCAECVVPGLDGGVVGGSILVFDELALLVAENY